MRIELEKTVVQQSALPHAQQRIDEVERLLPQVAMKAEKKRGQIGRDNGQHVADDVAEPQTEF